jgi:hypothetical protein
MSWDYPSMQGAHWHPIISVPLWPAIAYSSTRSGNCWAYALQQLFHHNLPFGTGNCRRKTRRLSMPCHEGCVDILKFLEEKPLAVHECNPNYLRLRRSFATQRSAAGNAIAQVSDERIRLNAIEVARSGYQTRNGPVTFPFCYATDDREVSERLPPCYSFATAGTRRSISISGEDSVITTISPDIQPSLSINAAGNLTSASSVPPSTG